MDATKEPIVPKVRNASFETPTARLKKEPRRKPYWFSIARRVALGYRRNANGEGSWSVRVTNGNAQWTKLIAAANDYREANGRDVLGYYEAVTLALTVAQQNGGGEVAPTDAPATLGDALDAYREDLKVRGGNPYNAERVRRLLNPILLARPVMFLTSAELVALRAELIRKNRPATVNRYINSLRAACELAMKRDPRITSNRAWKVGLEKLPNANAARDDVILPDDMVRKLIDAAYELDRKFGMMIELAAVTGARLSQLSRITVGDLQTEARRIGVPASRKGKVTGRDKKRPTVVPITAALAETLGKEAAGRANGEPLLLRANGEPWTSGPGHSWAQRLPFRAIATRCGLDPDRITLIALRHSSIVRQLLRGVPVRLVASLHDTSSAIIDSNYARHISNHGEALVRAALEGMEPPPAPNVVKLRRRAR
jgi:integrase